MKEGSFSKSSLLFYALALLVLIVGVYHFVEIEEIIELFDRLQFGWLLVALVTQAFTYICVASFVRQFLRTIENNHAISFWELFQTAIVMIFLNQTIPTAGVSGNTFLFSRLIKKGFTTAHAASLFILQAITNYLSHLLMLLLGLLLFFTIIVHTKSSLFLTVGTVGIIVYLFFLAFIFVFGEQNRIVKLHRLLTRWKLGRFLERYGIKEEVLTADRWHSTKSLLKEHPVVFLSTLGWQLLQILADVATIYALFQGLNFPMPFATILLCFTLTQVISILSIIPGALGFFEGSMTLFYTTLGISFPIALTVTLLFRGLSFWLPMPIGLSLYHRLQHRRVLVD